MAKSEEESTSVEEIVPAGNAGSEGAAADEARGEGVSPDATASRAPTLGQRLKWLLGFMLRIFILLIFLSLLAVGLAYSLPLLYQKYVRPVQENSGQLALLKDRLTQDEAALAALQDSLAALQGEQAQQAQSMARLDEKVQTLEEEVARHTQTLATIEKIQAALQAQDEALDADLERQIGLMKAMELLSRARLFLYQSNFGLARQDVRAARELLTAIQPAAPAALADDLAEVVQRLDLTPSNLPAFPVAASDDLDIAWHILLTGLPESQTQPVTETPLPAATITATPTAFATLEPTATP